MPRCEGPPQPSSQDDSDAGDARDLPVGERAAAAVVDGEAAATGVGDDAAIEGDIRDESIARKRPRDIGWRRA